MTNIFPLNAGQGQAARTGNRRHVGGLDWNEPATDYWMVAGSVASTTFKLRAGVGTSGTLTVNGSGGNRSADANALRGFLAGRAEVAKVV